MALLAALGAGTAVLIAAAPGSGTRRAHQRVPAPVPVITLRVADTVVARLALSAFRGRDGVDGLRRAVIAALPRTKTVTVGRARITYTYDRDRAARRAVMLPGRGGSVAVARQAVASRIAAPVIAQTLRNDCEAAALSILLASVGVSASQARLQAMFARSEPPDPITTGASTVWGDPDRGFVGRVDGGGTAGGFGVYPRPVVAAARRLRVKLTNLTGAAPEAIYRRLLSGRAVIAWVGLGDGPYDTWQTPAGETITVNLNEHTVVLRGINQDGTISVSNPLHGTAETWSRQQFEAMWQLLGRRALST